MAIVNLKDVTVERLNGKGFGVKVAEKYQVQGNDRKTQYTVWFKEPHGLNVGDIVSLSGFLGAKVGEPWVGQDGQERRSVELSLNEPRIQAGGDTSRQASASVANSAPVADAWATPAAPQQSVADQWAGNNITPDGFADTTPF